MIFFSLFITQLDTVIIKWYSRVFNADKITITLAARLGRNKIIFFFISSYINYNNILTVTRVNFKRNFFFFFVFRRNQLLRRCTIVLKATNGMSNSTGIRGDAYGRTLFLQHSVIALTKKPFFVANHEKYKSTVKTRFYENDVLRQYNRSSFWVQKTISNGLRSTLLILNF